MREDQTNRLRQFYGSQLGQLEFLKGYERPYINEMVIDTLANELGEINQEFPDLLPIFNLERYLDSSDEGMSWYDAQGILTFVTMAVSRLKVASEVPRETPITESRTFDFINDEALRGIIERDYDEIQRTYISKCWKSVIILCGGAIEAILTDLLLKSESQAKASPKAPSKDDIRSWYFSDLINVCVDLKLIESGVKRFSYSIKEYRNLVHPGNELKNKLTFDAEEARIALEILNILHRDLS